MAEPVPAELRCSLAVLGRAHDTHTWEPQPGMTPVHCPGRQQLPADRLRVLVDRACNHLTPAEGEQLRTLTRQLAAGRETWRSKAAEIERDRDRLAAERDSLGRDRAELAEDSLRRTRIELEHWQQVIVPDLRAERDRAREVAVTLEQECAQLATELEQARRALGRRLGQLEQARHELDVADRTARRILEQRQEMAAERYQWQERGDRAEQQLANARELLAEQLCLAEITHRYGAMGGHDSLGEGLTCAGCALNARIRTALDSGEQPEAECLGCGDTGACNGGPCAHPDAQQPAPDVERSTPC
ncbi:hypothetical protein LHJ74_14535 [Streptomyces sp. N2-109]|uniref:Uncharacterized protein n=1 Tax=Streptomyces gossypii TaxID=2883101 RepID=A0ABT2JT94_9ACTN|nr:hypothetical protein [Streptomyces gossypii]MCT2591111.1 hypothetical protein [Streptomyces gossypii]